MGSVNSEWIERCVGGLGRRFVLPLLAACVLVPGGPAAAQESADSAETGAGSEAPADDVEELVTIGTRTGGRLILDSPVPVDVLSEEAMTYTGETEVGRMIQNLAPSFNFSSSTISDGTDSLRPATLRGLGPDQTLVLVNGKRRHGSALVHVNTSVGRGTAGTDLNAIPASAIKRIEILRDGAAAQYGSDAIAGVINLVLKDSSDIGLARTSYGQTGESDGETWVGSINKGFAVGEGFLNLGMEYRDRGRTNRAGLSGVCQYVGTCTTDPVTGNQVTTDAREIAFPRQNFRIGDADSQQLSFTSNFGLPVFESNEIYAFALYSLRENLSGGFYRRANQASRNPTFLNDGVTPVNTNPVTGLDDAFYPDGFLPLIGTDIDDVSVNGGIKGWTESGWNWDLGTGWGKNDFAFTIQNSVNASLVSATGTSPTEAFAGKLTLEQFTVDFDTFKQYDWGVLAGGASLRRDTYQISPGEEVSYKDYDNDLGGPLNASGGIQVFPGFSPENAVDENRDSVAVYVDAEATPLDWLLFGVAGRFEDYSDFGSTFNWKLTTALDPMEWMKLRAAVSTGFRAPSLQQQFFNNTSTQFVTDPITGLTVAEQRGTFRNDSQVAQAIGIPELDEETSFNGSVGVTLLPLEGLTVSVDYFHISIEDRIAISGSIGTGLTSELDAALAAAQASSAQFFLNAADTTTQGVDAVVSYEMDLFDGDLDLSFAGNYTQTEIDKIKVGPGLLAPIQGKVFTSQDQSILEEWQPETRFNWTAIYERGPIGLTLAVNRYGEYTVEEGNGDRQTFGAKTLVDIQVSYAIADRSDRLEFLNGLTFRVGGKNIFDVTPDRNNIGQSRGGTIVDGTGQTIVSSPGVFKYSRRAAPFGFNGSAWYIGMDYAF